MTAPTDNQLSLPVVHGFLIVYLDLMNGVAADPIRAALAAYNVAIPAAMTGDADIDGWTFSAVDPTAIGIGPVTHTDGGSETVTLTLSATIAGDAETLNQLGDQANFRGRVAKVLIGLHDGAGTVISARFTYIGYMQVPAIESSQESQTISLKIENYLSLYSGGAPARTLLSQKRFDSGDLSAEATTGAANGQQVIAPGFSLGVGGGWRDLGGVKNV